VKDRLIQWWAVRLLKIFKIRLHLSNPRQINIENQNYLIVANHISWLDIHILNSIKPVTFVAKSEVGSWPIFGYLARQIGTLFIVRERPSDIKRVLSQMQAHFSYRSVSIFPEGTSSDGRTILPFKTNLFQAAIDSDRAILPVLIQFRQRGAYSDIPIFVGDMGLVDSIRRIANHDDIEAHVHLLDVIETFNNRREACMTAEQNLLSHLTYLRNNETMTTQ
jgi:1-acyl-sn-glycerol-3-phosphate acyltransferase